MNREPKPCECGEANVEFRASITDLDGIVIDTVEICRECYSSCTFEDCLTIPPTEFESILDASVREKVKDDRTI